MTSGGSTRDAQPRRVLVVEDDEMMGAFYQSLFRRNAREFAAHLEITGEAALAYLVQHPADAVILDWDLPGIKGVEMLEVLQSHPRGRAAKIFVISGGASEADRLFALENGAHDYLEKPFHVQEMLARLRNLLRK